MEEKSSSKWINVEELLIYQEFNKWRDTQNYPKVRKIDLEAYKTVWRVKYTGIGSRTAPKEIFTLMTQIAKKLDGLGYTLRSGNCMGSDLAFEAGATSKEIFIPWKNFGEGIVPQETEFAHNLLKEVHPAYDKLSQAALKLHLRNINQVLGENLNEPSQFLICWAKTDKEGIPIGGTRTAWMIAQKYNVPCFNLAQKEDLERILKLIV